MSILEQLAILVFILLLFSLWKHNFKVRLFTLVKQAVSFFLSCLLVGIVWESFGVIRGHWSLGENYLVGLSIGLLPIEDYLFMIIVPFSVAVFYKTILLVNADIK